MSFKEFSRGRFACAGYVIHRRGFACSRSLRHGIPSANQDEVSHFAALAQSWWDSSGPQRILHKMNLLRMDYIRDTLSRYGSPSVFGGGSAKISMPLALPGYSLDLLPPGERAKYTPKGSTNTAGQNAGKNAVIGPSSILEHLNNKLAVLDVGCGGGLLAESLARSNFVKKVTAIDATEECIKAAEEHRRQDPTLVKSKKLEYKYAGVESLESDAQYDVVTLFEILEHVESPSDFLRTISSKVAPGGYVFMSTINRTPVSYLTTILAAEKVLKIVPEGTHTWSKYINSAELANWFKKQVDPHTNQAQWEVIRADGCLYVPACGWMLTENASLGNYFMVVRRTKNEASQKKP